VGGTGAEKSQKIAKNRKKSRVVSVFARNSGFFGCFFAFFGTAVQYK
jgi:hypothetical protein